MDGSTAPMSVAITDALYNLLPDTLLEKYNKAHEILSNFRNNELLKGHIAPSDKQAYDEAKNFVESLNDNLNKLFVEDIEIENINKAGEKYTAKITRLAPFKYGKSAVTGEAKATEGAQIEYLIKQLQEIADNNKALIDAEEEYKKLIPDPEKFIEDNPYQTKLNTSEAERKMQQRSYDANNISRLLNDNNAKTERYKTYQLEAESRINKAGSKEGQENIVIGTYKTILNALSKSEKAQGKLGAYHLLKTKDSIELYNKILGDNFTAFRNNIMAKIKESEVFKELLSNPKLGKITETNMDWTLPKYRQEFKNIFSKAFKETVNENGEYIKAFGSTELDKWTDEVLDNFDNYLKENPEKGMQELMADYAYDNIVDTTKEVSSVSKKENKSVSQLENQIKNKQQELDNNLEFYPEENQYEAKDIDKYEKDTKEIIALQQKLEKYKKYKASKEQAQKIENINREIANKEKIQIKLIKQKYSHLSEKQIKKLYEEFLDLANYEEFKNGDKDLNKQISFDEFLENKNLDLSKEELDKVETEFLDLANYEEFKNGDKDLQTYTSFEDFLQLYRKNKRNIRKKRRRKNTTRSYRTSKANCNTIYGTTG